MDSSFSTYVVDVANVSGGLPSSGGLRDMDGRILAQYINPRPYMSVSNSSSFLMGLGIVSGLGLLALGAYLVYDWVCDYGTTSTYAPPTTNKQIRIVARKTDGGVTDLSRMNSRISQRIIVSDDLLVRRIHKRDDRLQDDDFSTLAT